jgi:hypothetical protein
MTEKNNMLGAHILGEAAGRHGGARAPRSAKALKLLLSNGESGQTALFEPLSIAARS